MRNDTEAANKEALAKQVYDFYNEQCQAEHRIDLPPFPRMRFEALQDFLADQQYPVTLRRSLMGRIRIERPDLFEELRQQLKQLNSQSSPEAKS
jgi:hypothetical protein